MANERRIHWPYKALGVILALSVFANIWLALAYVDLARRQNTAWNNGMSEVAKVCLWLATDYRENPSAYDLQNANTHIQMLFQQVNMATELPYGNDIIPFATVQDISSFLNYETQVVQLMQSDLKQKGSVSAEDMQRWQVISEGWRSMFSTLQQENSKVEPFSPVFRKEVWQNVWTDAVKALDKVEPVPLRGK